MISKKENNFWNVLVLNVPKIKSNKKPQDIWRGSRDHRFPLPKFYFKIKHVDSKKQIYIPPPLKKTISNDFFFINSTHVPYNNF